MLAAYSQRARSVPRNVEHRATQDDRSQRAGRRIPCAAVPMRSLRPALMERTHSVYSRRAVRRCFQNQTRRFVEAAPFAFGPRRRPRGRMLECMKSIHAIRRADSAHHTGTGRQGGGTLSPNGRAETSNLAVKTPGDTLVSRMLGTAGAPDSRGAAGAPKGRGACACA